MDRERYESLFDLTGRTAIITGGTRGIGFAIAEGFGHAGANVVVAGRKPEGCAQAQAALIEAGIETLAVPTHIGDADGREALVQAATDRFGGIDILVNNAANALTEPLGHQSASAWQKSFEVNLVGPALLTQSALSHLEKSGRSALARSCSRSRRRSTRP